MTKYCPITCECIEETFFYSKKGLHLLSPKLTHLNPLPYSAQEQRQEAIIKATKLSVQGVQPKISAVLDVKSQTFVFVDQGGLYILKPENANWPELPANEAISMSMAKLFKIEAPLHGLIFNKDQSLTYFIKRFDRYKKEKRAVEDFSQLSEKNRDRKYESTIEQIIKIIDKYSTFPKIDHIKLFKRLLFNFVIGNEDMHLKNYSLINEGGTYQLSPAYDFLNTTIAIGRPEEESALSLNGRKNKLRRQDFVDYLALERLGLSEKVTSNILLELESLKSDFADYIQRSYLSETMKEAYITIVENRYERLFN